MSSTAMPIRPAISARSVPCPRYVRANDPESVMTAFAISSSISPRAARPMRAAPAVCELEGPIITGPIMSNMSKGMPPPSFAPRVMERFYCITNAAAYTSARAVSGAEEGRLIFQARLIFAGGRI